MYIYLYVISCLLSPKYKLNSYNNYNYIQKRDEIRNRTYSVKIVKSKSFTSGARIWYFFKG